MSWIWLVAAVVSELAATLSLRASDGFRDRRWLAPVIAGYAIAFGFLALALQAGMAVGVAYGIWAAAGVAMVAILARLIWKDPLTLRMAAGIAIVALGVVLVETGTH
ncbi:DMT family transporter [Salininema proteolyticum]|uniref:DMT family transporter n=1 Tax=Salininema proteolyticum TaxID=1607685 RepID=A0ABV8U5F2_9ACTN